MTTIDDIGTDATIEGHSQEGARTATPFAMAARMNTSVRQHRNTANETVQAQGRRVESADRFGDEMRYRPVEHPFASSASQVSKPLLAITISMSHGRRCVG